MKKSIYICPSCGQKLSQAKQINKCSKCGSLVKVDNFGNISFINKSYYWGEIPPKKMSKVLSQSRKYGWKKAVADLTLEYPKMEEYLLNSARVDWIYHCLSNARETALDIGSGWGSLAFNLANFYRDVYSLEAVEARSEFQKIRKNQDEVKNLHIVRADFMKLPFADNSFDLVAVNGVLEWVGIAQKGNPRDLQIKFLKEIYRVLKPNGCLYIGIENRFGFHYLLGADDHSGLPFTSIVPRFLADVIVRNLRKTEGRYKLRIRIEQEWNNYRTYTYSLPGYRKLLIDSGFKSLRPYWTLFYSNPKFSGPIDGNSFTFFLKLLSKNTSGDKISFGKILSVIGLQIPNSILKLISEFLAPCYLLYAYKSNTQNRLESDLVGNNSFLKVSGSGAVDSRVNYFILHNQEVKIVKKFARFSKYNSIVGKEELIGKNFGNIPVLSQGKINDFEVFNERYINAERINPYNLVQNKLVLDYLFDLQSKKISKAIGTIEIDRLITFTKSKSLNKNLLVNLKTLKTQIKDGKIKTSLVHGDFCSMNILIDKDDKLYVLDWEDYEERGYVFEDFIFYIIHSLAKKYNPRQIAKLLNNPSKLSFLSKSLEKFKNKYHFDDSLIKQSVYYLCLKKIQKFEQLGGRHVGHRDFYLSLIKYL